MTLGILVCVALAIVLVCGWLAHLWWCMHVNKSCPVWVEKVAREWNPKAELEGWRKRRHKPKGPGERHPTPPAEPIDPTPGSGVPLPDTDDVETKPSNPKRRTP
jgi:hypothetical protein